MLHQKLVTNIQFLFIISENLRHIIKLSSQTNRCLTIFIGLDQSWYSLFSIPSRNCFTLIWLLGNNCKLLHVGPFLQVKLNFHVCKILKYFFYLFLTFIFYPITIRIRQVGQNDINMEFSQVLTLLTPL